MIREFVPLDDCLGSTHTVRVHLDGPLNRRGMERLAAGGVLQFHPQFPKPFFRIDHPAGFIAQGVLGNDHFRITYLKENKPGVLLALREIFPGTTANLPSPPADPSI